MNENFTDDPFSSSDNFEPLSTIPPIKTELLINQKVPPRRTFPISRVFHPERQKIISRPSQKLSSGSRLKEE
jgi:hypothetical protein